MKQFYSTTSLYILALLVLPALPMTAQVILPAGTATVTLQNNYPSDSIFTLPPGNTITTAATAIEGDNSRNWQFTSQGVVTGGTTVSGSGLQLGSRDSGATIVNNEDSIISLWPESSSPSGIRFINGGQVYNKAGGWIEGYDGIHTDNFSILVENSGTIYGNHTGGSAIYSGEGLQITNLVGGLIDGTNYGISSNGFGNNAEIRNFGVISGSHQAIYLYNGNVYGLHNAPGALIHGGGNETIKLEGSQGYLLNEGKITGDKTALYLNNSGGNNIYINVDSIIANNGYAINTEATEKGNVIYNLGVLTGTLGSIRIEGDSTLLVLGQTAFLPRLNRYVTGVGSRLNGDAISEGAYNKLLLTDTGSEDNRLSGFQSLTLNGTAWALSRPITLADSLVVRAGTLTLSDSISLVNTAGAIVIENNGVLSLADSVHIETPGDAVFRVEAGGLLHIFHTYSATGGNFLTLPDSTVISGTVQFDSLLVINNNLTLSGATLDIHPGADTIRVNGAVNLTGGNNRINLASYELGTYYTVLTASGGITGGAGSFPEVLHLGTPLPTCNYEIVVTPDTIKLLLKDGSVAITQQPAGSIVCLGDSYTFQIQATGENLSYAWYKNDVVIDGQNTATLTIPNAALSDQGTYYVSVSNGCQTVDSQTAYLTVEIPVPTGIDQTGKSILDVYPNPVTDWLYIDYGSLLIRNVMVMDITGRLIYQVKPETTTYTVDASGWQAGIYLVRIGTADGKTTVRKVIRK